MLVWFYVYLHHHVTGNARFRFLTLTPQLHRHPVLNTCRHLYLQLVHLLRLTRALAGATWPVDYFAPALARPARLYGHQRGKPTLVVDALGLPPSVAHATPARLCPFGSPGPAAAVALFQAWDLHIFLLAPEHVFKRQLHVVDKVAALAAAKAKKVPTTKACRAAPAKELLKNIPKAAKAHVAEDLFKVCFRAAEDLVCAHVAVRVVALALVIVRKESVGF